MTAKAASFCLPIIEDSLSRCVQRLQAAPASYQYCEIWLEYLPELSRDELSMLVASSERRLVFLTRALELAPPTKPLAYRRQCLEHLSAEKVLIDLDIQAQAEEIALLATQPFAATRLWSYHNYQLTPSLDELRGLQRAMHAAQAEIYKFSCFCANSTHAVTLLRLLQELKDQKQRFIISGMGTAGLMPRIAAALWGNEFSFAPLEAAQASAPGQLCLADFQLMLNKLGAHGGQ